MIVGRNYIASNSILPAYNRNYNASSKLTKINRVLKNSSHAITINPNIQSYSRSDDFIGVIKTADYETLEQLVEYPKFDINKKYIEGCSVKGCTALMFASTMDDYKSIKILLKSKTLDPNIQDKYGFTALMHAASIGSHKAIKALLKSKTLDPNIQDKSGYTALMHAASTGGHKAIKALLKSKGLDRNIQNNFGGTALMFSNEVKSVKALIKDLGVGFEMRDITMCSAWMGSYVYQVQPSEFYKFNILDKNELIRQRDNAMILAWRSYIYQVEPSWFYKLHDRDKNLLTRQEHSRLFRYKSLLIRREEKLRLFPTYIIRNIVNKDYAHVVVNLYFIIISIGFCDKIVECKFLVLSLIHI